MTSPLKKNKHEIIWNCINAGLAGGISLFSAFAAVGNFTSRVFFVAICSSIVVALIKFKDYWDGERKEYQKNIFNFL